MSKPKAHRNLAIRGGIAVVHGFLSLIMVSFGISVPYFGATSVCQFVAAATLFTQWWTANPLMFVARAAQAWIRCIFVTYSAICGRNWEAEECVSGVWSDERWKYRIPFCVGALVLFLNGLSLFLQFLYPRRGVGVYGNEQLFYRGCVRAAALPVHFFAAIMKLGDLTGTPAERLDIEVIINFIRGLFLAPAAAWSLWNQWVTTGSGKQTDDIRTNYVGEEEGDVLTSMGQYIDQHKGHRNLLFRCMCALGQGVTTCCLVAYSVDIFHNTTVAMCQFVSAVALYVQWHNKHPAMFLVRAFTNLIRCVLVLHIGVCGRHAPSEECETHAWHDVRRPFRALSFLSAARMLSISGSLFLEWCFPTRGVTESYGNEQLYYRSYLRAVGMPLYLARAIESTMLNDTEFARTKLEVAVDFLRACYFIPLQSASLYEQWLHSGRPGTAEEQEALLELAETSYSDNEDSDEESAEDKS